MFFCIFFICISKKNDLQSLTSSIEHRNNNASATTQLTTSSSSSSNRTSSVVNPRRSWSSIAFNNKNFPDGKLVYENNQINNNNIDNNNSNTTTPASKTGFSKSYTKFERSSQDVMAKASQIVQ